MEVPQFFADLFAKYLENRCSPEETAYLWSLINSDEYRAYANELIDKQLSKPPAALHEEFALRSRLDRRLQLILEKENSAPEITTFPMHRVAPVKIWRWVAAACLLLTFSGAGYYLLTPEKKVEVTMIERPFHIAPSVSYIRYLTLPDGSTVVLHAGSRLQYPAHFDGSAREVVLSGEAYFDIAHNADKPFVIHTGKIKTIVLGTAFNIKADEKQVVVSVTRGKVRVENGSEVLAVLTPNEQVKFNLPEEKTVQQKVNANDIVTDWTKEDMVFNGISFQEIAGILSKRYGVNVKINNESLKNCKVRASFSGTEKLEQVASVVCGIRNGVYEQLPDGTIVLNGEGCDVTAVQ